MAVKHNHRYSRFEAEGRAREVKAIAAESVDIEIARQYLR